MSNFFKHKFEIRGFMDRNNPSIDRGIKLNSNKSLVGVRVDDDECDAGLPSNQTFKLTSPVTKRIGAKRQVIIPPYLRSYFSGRSVETEDWQTFDFSRPPKDFHRLNVVLEA